MAKTTWSTRIRHDSTATWWEWRDELITKLGLMVTAGTLAADETNITPGVGSLPALNTEGGYAVFHLADSLHATAPIYIRFGFGIQNGSNSPRLQVTVGTTTNGSGVFGGIVGTIVNIHSTSTSTQTSDTTRNSYLCVVAGFFGLSWKQGGTAVEGLFQISRTVDSTGAPTATGAIATWGLTSTNSVNKTQAFRYAATAAAYAAQSTVTNTALGLNPQSPTSTLVGSDIQVALGWTITPAVAPIVGVCGVLNAEVGPGVSFTATLVGTTPRTYLALTVAAGPFGPIDATNSLKYAMLWE